MPSPDEVIRPLQRPGALRPGGPYVDDMPSPLPDKLTSTAPRPPMAPRRMPVTSFKDTEGAQLSRVTAKDQTAPRPTVVDAFAARATKFAAQEKSAFSGALLRTVGIGAGLGAGSSLLSGGDPIKGAVAGALGGAAFRGFGGKVRMPGAAAKAAKVPKPTVGAGATAPIAAAPPTTALPAPKVGPAATAGLPPPAPVPPTPPPTPPTTAPVPPAATPVPTPTSPPTGGSPGGGAPIPPPGKPRKPRNEPYGPPKPRPPRATRGAGAAAGLDAVLNVISPKAGPTAIPARSIDDLLGVDFAGFPPKKFGTVGLAHFMAVA